MPNKIAIFIPDDEAKQFLVFQKNYTLFQEMEKQQVFDIKYGEVTLHFQDGVLDFLTKKEVFKVIHT